MPDEFRGRCDTQPRVTLVRSPSSRGRRAFAVALLAPVAGLTQPSTPIRLGLRWSDPSSLAPLTPSELDARLSKRLGHPAFEPGVTPDALSVRWLGTREQCAVELELLQGARIEGTRRIESPTGDCRSLAPALLAVAALLIEGQPEPPNPPAARTDDEGTAGAAGAEALEAGPTPQQPPEPAAAGPRARVVPAPAAPPPASAVGEPLALLSLGAAVSAGLAPKVELGPSVALVLTRARHFRAGLRAAVFLPQEQATRPGMELGHAQGTLLACGMPLVGSFAAGVCGSVGLHRFRSVGISLPLLEEVRSYVPMLGVTVRAEWRIAKQLWWVADLGAELAPSPLRFHFSNAAGEQMTVFEQKRVAPMLSFGPTLELP
jgi:hypothetical protein